MRRTIASPRAPKAIGPYSQAVVTHHVAGIQMLHAAGQIPIDPATGDLVAGDVDGPGRAGDGEPRGGAGARRHGLRRRGEDHGLPRRPGRLRRHERGLRPPLPGEFPARSTVQVAALPKGARIEVEVHAVKHPPAAARPAAKARVAPARKAGPRRKTRGAGQRSMKAAPQVGDAAEPRFRTDVSCGGGGFGGREGDGHRRAFPGNPPSPGDPRPRARRPGRRHLREAHRRHLRGAGAPRADLRRLRLRAHRRPHPRLHPGRHRAHRQPEQGLPAAPPRSSSTPRSSATTCSTGPTPGAVVLLNTARGLEPFADTPRSLPLRAPWTPPPSRAATASARARWSSSTPRWPGPTPGPWGSPGRPWSGPSRRRGSSATSRRRGRPGTRSRCARPTTAPDAPRPAGARALPVVGITEHLTRPPHAAADGLVAHPGAHRTARTRRRATPGCPAGNDVVGFVQALKNGRGRGGGPASSSAPSRSPSVCGRVCPAPCMADCNRGAYDGAVDIRGLERWIGDHVAGASVRPRPRGRSLAGSPWWAADQPGWAPPSRSRWPGTT